MAQGDGWPRAFPFPVHVVSRTGRLPACAPVAGVVGQSCFLLWASSPATSSDTLRPVWFLHRLSHPGSSALGTPPGVQTHLSPAHLAHCPQLQAVLYLIDLHASAQLCTPPPPSGAPFRVVGPHPGYHRVGTLSPSNHQGPPQAAWDSQSLWPHRVAKCFRGAVHRPLLPHGPRVRAAHHCLAPSHLHHPASLTPSF